MSYLEYFVFGLSLSMDALAVAICKGLSIKKLNLKAPLTVGAYFGFFQGLMPLIGFYLGSVFSKYITAFDHWVAFLLLALIGANMIKESFDKNYEADDSLTFKSMFPLAIATSIDALAIGVTLSLLPGTKIIPAVTIIGVTTFVLSFFGVKLGNVFGMKYKSKAEFFGGITLVIMGLKILLEHLLGA